MSNDVSVNNGLKVITVKTPGLRGFVGPVGPPGTLQSAGNIVATGSLYVSGSTVYGGGNITASGNISASGNIYGNIIYAHRFESSGSASSIDISDSLDVTGEITASGNIKTSGYVTAQHITASGNIKAAGTIIANQINLDDSGKIYFNEASTTDQYIQGQDSNILIESDNFLNVNADQAVNLNTPLVAADGIVSGSSIVASQHITASGNISASFTSTGSFGRLEVESIKATTGEFAANTIKLGNETFNQANITKLKAGKSLRDISTLQAKSYELADGRKISREFENRFNRWAPNLEFEDKEGAEGKLYNEVDQIPQTFIDFTDKEYRVNMFGGRSHQKQTLYNIELKSDYRAGDSSLDFKSPKAVFSTGHGDVEVKISGSLDIKGNIKGNNNFDGWVSSMGGFGNQTTITKDITVPNGYNLILWTSKTNPSITINSGINYNISLGADVSIRNI